MFPDIFHISFSNKDENVYVVNHLVKMLFNLQTPTNNATPFSLGSLADVLCASTTSSGMSECRVH
jgi:hypothetical protein